MYPEDDVCFSDEDLAELVPIPGLDLNVPVGTRVPVPASLPTFDFGNLPKVPCASNIAAQEEASAGVKPTYGKPLCVVAPLAPGAPLEERMDALEARQDKLAEAVLKSGESVAVRMARVEQRPTPFWHLTWGQKFLLLIIAFCCAPIGMLLLSAVVMHLCGMNN